VNVHAKQVLLAQGEPISHVYFPLGGLYSLAVIMTNGRMAETAAIGNDGLIGLTSVLGAPVTPVEVLCHVPYPLLRISADVLARHVAERPTIREAILHFATALLIQTQRNAACN